MHLSSNMIKESINNTNWSNKLQGTFNYFLLALYLFICITYIIISNHSCCNPSINYNILPWTSRQLKFLSSPPRNDMNEPTNINHLVFGIAGASNTWENKKLYIESWWKPNITRGYLFLDRPPIEHLPWPPTSPLFKIYEDTSKYNKYHKHKMPFAIRMVHIVEETFKIAENDGENRWVVMSDDDTVFFLDNLVEVLSKYDHRKYFYIGMNSECVISNFDNSFEMAFGGAGYALSYPLAKALAMNIDLCIKRYPSLYGSDHILQSCIADLGVSLTREVGFHQLDLHHDISGFLSAHPQSPFISLHHLDIVDPIFPSMNRHQALNHLMNASKIDASRLLQQSICYYHKTNWTISVAWGYSIQIYENILPPSLLHKPIETFSEWRRGAKPSYMFNSRRWSNDPCEAPHVFFFDYGNKSKDHVHTDYVRKYPRRLLTCAASGNHSAEGVFKVEVFSPVAKLQVGNGNKRECCEVLHPDNNDTVIVKMRACMGDELITRRKK